MNDQTTSYSRSIQLEDTEMLSLRAGWVLRRSYSRSIQLEDTEMRLMEEERTEVQLLQSFDPVRGY